MAQATVNETESSRRRRAIYAGLAPFMSELQVLEALWLWEEEFGRGAAFALHGYISRVCSSPALTHLRGDIHRSLVKAMSTPLDELGPEPWPKMRALRAGRANAARAAVATTTAASAVFTATLRGFLDLLHNYSPEYGKAMRLTLIRNLAQFHLDAAAADQVIRWLNESATTLSARLSVGQMRGLLHLGYRLACEYHGPVIADRALADAVHDAEHLPEAREFAPRSLL